MDILIVVLISGLIWGAIYALISMGLALIWGVMNIVNFAHGDFLMVGMYIAYTVFLVSGLDPLWSVPVAGVVLFGVGALTYLLIIRKVEGSSPLIQIVATFAVALFLRNLMQMIFKTDYLLIKPEEQSVFHGSIKVLGNSINSAQVTAAVLSLIAAFTFYIFVKKTRTGTTILAVAENPYAAKLMGINLTKINTLTWGLGAAIVGVSGALLSKFYYIFPTSGIHFGVLSFIIVALGGFRSIPGAFVAGILVGVLESVIGFVGDPAYKVAFIFVLYIGVTLVRPKGLFGY